MPLEGKTAVVTGAARGIGRGIALVLGEAGVTVYLTDRETRRRKRSPLPGTVEDTAEQGGLDLLVANAFGGDPDTIALHVYYDLAMHATSRLAFGLAQDLRSHGVTALAISPGFTRTEAITAQLGDLPPGSDSIEFPGGRCVPCWTTRTWPAMPATPSRSPIWPKNTGSAIPRLLPRAGTSSGGRNGSPQGDAPKGHAAMSQRLKTVVDQLAIRPDDRVLEIGCGHGVAATMVCERLEAGRLTAIDRSAKMIEAAARRNAACVETGKAEFLVMSLEEADLGDRRFDVIFAVRVGLFHREPERAHALVQPLLAPGGRVRACFDPPTRR
jgi:NAD(P)-dependent dehydrogenase (short-subunit alcohol dehydrogenase family)